jgi:hypothetical protein
MPQYALHYNEVEYTGNLSFAKDFTYPLLDGFSAFWSYLLNDTTGDGFLHDANSLAADSEFEHRSAIDPNTALALMKRITTVQLSLAGADSLWTSLCACVRHADPRQTRTVCHRAVDTRPDEDRVGSGKGAERVAVDVLGQRRLRSALPRLPVRVHRPVECQCRPAQSRAPHVSWPFVVRSATRDSAASVINAFTFTADSSNGFGPNLIKYAPGGGTGHCGLAQALNNMLLGSPGGKITLTSFQPGRSTTAAGIVQAPARQGGLLRASFVEQREQRTVEDLAITAGAAAAAADGCPPTCTIQNLWPVARGRCSACRRQLGSCRSIPMCPMRPHAAPCGQISPAALLVIISQLGRPLYGRHRPLLAC